ncbi:hypothetical protein jhhlp_003696 [Lomentospora prolificans]|uniref:ATP-dependent RNA helicase n=1 Tax=Lomentospora prolificans TaxID=41688 RepID=A0A2N3N9M9_9PEZI|nr:hypothetical protein jhhlp_003696 [Lomentospora prolificans]
MLRQGLRTCAPMRRACIPSAASISQFQPRAMRLVKAPSVTLRPVFRNSFHYSRILRAQSAEAAEAEAVESASEKPLEPQNLRFEDAINEGIHPNLIRSITRDMGYEYMTDVQEKTVRAGLRGTDLVAQAKTGTGKTIAFLLPMLQRMIDEDPTLASKATKKRARPDDIRGIVISPTRELAEQIGEEAKALVRHTGLVVQLAVGGQRKDAMLRNVQRNGCHLLVATPGRLKDILEDEYSGVEAPNLAALVLDEADRMLDVGFSETLKDIQKMLPDVGQKERQTLLFSATIPKDVVGLAKAMVRRDKFEFIQTIRPDEALTHERIPQKVVVAPSQVNVFPALYELIDREVAKSKETPNARPFKAIVYYSLTTMVDLAVQVDSTIKRLRRGTHDYPRTYYIHGQLKQGQRTAAADAFRRAKSAVLISSDVTARGMDFPDVTHVIQVGPPVSREQYIHRLGRTGRQDKDGEGWLIITNTEVDDVRSKVGDLPLVPDKTLESASLVVESEDMELPETFQHVRSAFERVSGSVLADVYKARFGAQGRHNVQGLVNDMNKWSKITWGWEEPPAVAEHWVQKMGYGRIRGFNVAPGRSKLGARSRDREFKSSEPSDQLDSFDSFQNEFGSRGRNTGRPRRSRNWSSSRPNNYNNW